jgi:hypothetical protein
MPREGGNLQRSLRSRDFAMQHWRKREAGDRRPIHRCIRRAGMDEDKFNVSLRKFLKQVGVTSQREIERVVREGGPRMDVGPLKVKMVLTMEGTDLEHVVEGDIEIG